MMTRAPIAGTYPIEFGDLPRLRWCEQRAPAVLQSSDSDERLVDATVRAYSTERVKRL